MLFSYFAGMRSAAVFKRFIIPFSQKLSAVDLPALAISAYAKRYLQHLFDHHLYYLDIYASVLDQLSEHSSKAESHLVDFGAGNGLLGLFAKFAGFKKVWLCDRDPEFVEASRVLAAALGIEMDGFVEGAENTLQIALGHERIDAVVGTDVIEHIYDLEHFFAALASINTNMVTVFTTASNPDNFLKCRALKKLQIQDELLGSNPEDSQLAGAEKTEAFLQSRKKIIAGHFPQLTHTELTFLSKTTRGLIEADIIKAVHTYLHTGQVPVADTGTVNTCNPFNGSWTERILSIDAYKKLYGLQGFSLAVRNGYYNTHARGLKGTINFAGNIIVTVIGKYAAPYISLIGYKGV